MRGRSLPRHHSIGLNAMFEAVKFPASISNLNPSLPNVYAYDLPHLVAFKRREELQFSVSKKTRRNPGIELRSAERERERER